MKAAVVFASGVALACGLAAASAQDLLTTGIASSLSDVAYLDEARDPVFAPLTDVARDEDGGFSLDPGAYEADFESYCVLPGTHGPAAGDGYLLAPLAGEGAGLVRAVLDRSIQHPDLPQEDIQQLLWAILSRAPYSDLDAGVRRAAETLLTRDEIRDVERLSRESLAGRLRGALLDRAPEAVQRMLDAQERLRSLLTEASATYDEMREAAVLDGRPEPQPGDREIPPSRWSYHPDGYFVRVIPDGYTRARVQLVVPDGIRPSLARDARGRVVRAAYADGLVVEAEYDDTIPALDVPGDPALKGYAFRRLRFSNGSESVEIENRGWAFSGQSNGQGRFAVDAGDADAIGDFGHGPLALQDGWRQRYEDARSRYERFKELQEAREEQRKRQARDRDGPSESDVADVTDEGHYRDGYDAATKGEASDKLDWIDEQLRRTRNAFEYVHCRLTGGCEDKDDKKKTPPRKRKYRPSRDAAVPGAQGGQRLGIGARFGGR